MELSFSEIVQGILERNPDLGLRRHGKSAMNWIAHESEADAPRLLACKLAGRPKAVQTVGHGPGLAIALDLVFSGAHAGKSASGVRSLTIGPIERSGHASLLTARGLGWREILFDEEAMQQSRSGKKTVRLKGRVPFAFLAGEEQARFQVQLTNAAGNMTIELVGVPIPGAKQLVERFEKARRDDGDDPGDLPPPTIFGEEIDRDERVGLVYVVSDFHLGSSRYGKGASNDMDAQTLERFIRFLEACERDAADHPHYDVVMNGDFLDLWQAKRPSNDTYRGRLDDVIATNASFFAALGSLLRRTPKCRFYYVIGNHDDPLLPNPAPDDAAFGPDAFGAFHNKVRDTVGSVYESHLLPGIGREWSWRRAGATPSFTIQEQYSNSQLAMLALHGHQFDPANRRNDDGEPSGGQAVAEQVNRMQEGSERFANIEYVPLHETARHLKCLIENPSTPPAERRAIDELRDAVLAAELGVFGGFVAGAALTSNFMAEQLISRTRPETVRQTAREDGEEYLEDHQRRPPIRILVTGHTHLEELVPRSGQATHAYANTGSWFRRIRAGRQAGRCVLTALPSNLPYVRICREKDANRALVELLYFSGALAGSLVRVDLQS